MKVEIFDWSIWQYFRSRKFLILEASCSIAQLYFSHKCLWKFKCFRSSELIHTLFPKYLTKSQFTIYLIVFFTCLSIWHLSLVFSYRILATAWSWPFALSYIIIIIMITGKCPRVELGVGFNLLEIQRDLISIFRVESSRRWRCCRAWGRCRWEQSRFSRSASSSLRSSAPGPGPQEKLKKYSLKFVNLIKKITKIHMWRIFSTSGAAVLQKVLPVALGLAALRGHIALKSAALASAMCHQSSLSSWSIVTTISTKSIIPTCVVLLLSFRLVSALLSGGGGGNSSSPAEDNDDECKKYNYV